ncbi:MAG TPA: hypothetical protein VHO48_03760, partial [Anaerolineaceae bacterium]|nr:hypothetical protein [Anaerolineaceae bacterium]
DAWERAIEQARQAGHTVTCMEKVPLRMLTVNPFYPRYTGRSGFYEAAWVDPEELRKAVSQAIPEKPVVDVMRNERVDVLGSLDNA